MSRIQVVIDEAEREEFRAQARAEGQSLSEWLREAGRQRLLQQRPGRLDTPESVASFFAELNARTDAESDGMPEEEWHVVKRRMAAERYAELDPLGLET